MTALGTGHGNVSMGRPRDRVERKPEFNIENQQMSMSICQRLKRKLFLFFPSSVCLYFYCSIGYE